VLLCLLGSKDRKEHVEGNLYRVHKDKTMLVGNVLEVDGVDKRPDLPASLAGGQEIRLDLGTDDGERVSVYQTKIREENSHKEWAPKDLINSNLQGHISGTSSLDLVIQPVVEVVSGGSIRGDEQNKSM
jgi:hypothetical protein